MVSEYPWGSPLVALTCSSLLIRLKSCRHRWFMHLKKNWLFSREALVQELKNDSSSKFAEFQREKTETLSW